MTSTIDQPIVLSLHFNIFDGQPVTEWFDSSRRTPIHAMLMEFDASKYSYEDIRHALISVALSSTTPSHYVINDAIKAQATVVNARKEGAIIFLRLETTHWSQDTPLKEASFSSDWNTGDIRTVSIWFEYRSGGVSEEMYTAFLVEGVWRVLRFSRMVKQY